MKESTYKRFMVVATVVIVSGSLYTLCEAAYNIIRMIFN